MAQILVVEDEAQVRATLRQALEAVGHEVTEAADGRGAILAQRERPADLVFCDLFMPDMGVEAVRALQVQTPGVKVIAIIGGGGGYGGASQLLQGAARLMGVVGFVGMPFHMRDVVEAAQRALLAQG